MPTSPRHRRIFDTFRREWLVVAKTRRFFEFVKLESNGRITAAAPTPYGEDVPFRETLQLSERKAQQMRDELARRFPLVEFEVIHETAIDFLLARQERLLRSLEALDDHIFNEAVARPTPRRDLIET